MMRLPVATILAALLCTASRGIAAQANQDPAACKATLSAPTHDSALVRIGLRVRPFDTITARMATSYRTMITSGARQFFKTPAPLALHAYGDEVVLHGPKGDARFTTLILHTTYRAALHRDGHLSGIRAVGGTRDSTFDVAIIRALQMVSDSSLLAPPTAPEVSFNGDSVDLQFTVSSTGDREPVPSDVTSLLRLQLPLRQVTQQVGPHGGRRAPEYPIGMRASKIEGTTTINFVVDAKGLPDMESIQVVTTPAVAFVNAMLEVLPTYRFDPRKVDGCAVPTLVSLSFNFLLGP